MVSPIETMRSARRRYARTIWRSTRTANGFLSLRSLTGRLREHVLDDDDERHAEAGCEDEPDRADHRRVGHAEDDVRPLRRADRGRARARGSVK